MNLFWACRAGGGGNLGIATELTFRTHRVGPGSHVSASFAWRDAAGELSRFRQGIRAR